MSVPSYEPVAGTQDQDQWRAVAALRHRVRARMLEVCAEPDLADRNALAQLLEHRADKASPE